MIFNLVVLLALQQFIQQIAYVGGYTDDLEPRSLGRPKRIAYGQYRKNETNLIGSVVSIRSRVPSAFIGDNHFCTGTIVTDIFVITSARCVHKDNKIIFRARELLVVAGAFNRLIFAKDSYSMPVKFLMTHQNFTLENTYDIALLRLVNPIPEYHDLIDIVMPGFDPPQAGATCKVMGWGRVFKNGPLSNLLLTVDVVLKNFDECAASFKYFQPGMICAVGLAKRQSSGPCPGDTGGPLFCGEKLQGIVSYTTGCSKPGFPTVFVDMNFYSDWILESIENGSPPQAHFLFTSQLFCISGLMLCIVNLY